MIAPMFIRVVILCAAATVLVQTAQPTLLVTAAPE